MLVQKNQDLADKIWAVANKLRGPYRPPQYRKVMLPLIVLRRLDCVLEPSKAAVLKEFEAIQKKELGEKSVEKALSKVAGKDRKQPLYNVSPFTFAKLTGDPNGLAKNLTAYIKGFSPNMREIFEKFEFEKEIEKLEDSNRLFEVIREFSAIDLHPNTITNMDMGYVFEYLIRKFNEQANEEAGDHFTPREVIRLIGWRARAPRTPVRRSWRCRDSEPCDSRTGISSRGTRARPWRGFSRTGGCVGVAQRFLRSIACSFTLSRCLPLSTIACDVPGAELPARPTVILTARWIDLAYQPISLSGRLLCT